MEYQVENPKQCMDFLPVDLVDIQWIFFFLHYVTEKINFT